MEKSVVQRISLKTKYDGNISSVSVKKGERRKIRAPRLCCRFESKVGTVCKKSMEFLAGGIGYGLIEVIWRGRTHFSMLLAGGTCFVAICAINSAMKGKNILLRAGVCTLFITATEFLTGVLVNRILNLAVWSYDGMFGNVFGQICPLYTFLWFLLSIPLSFLADKTNA